MPTTPPPTQLGRYQILDEIGKGAMGVVYLAKDPLIGRLVALKTFHIGYTTPDDEAQRFRERFMREAQSAGILSHPNIVTVHDVVEESIEGATFIAMEYVRGTNLKEVMARDERLDLASIVDIVWQMCEALEYAHSKGVVHRDIKPANVIMTGDQRVKITDFGIARLNSSNLTHEGQLLGTPNYMAPEQVRGNDVDHRADIFSLGVVLYEMLTGSKPFAGDSLTTVTHRIVYDDFTAPERYVTNLPNGLLEVLSKVLAKSPAKRYQRAGELARDLKQVAKSVTSQAELNETQEIEPVAPAPPSRSMGQRMAGIVAPLAVLGRSLFSRLAGESGAEPERSLLRLRLALVAVAAVALAAVSLWLWPAAGPTIERPAPIDPDVELQRKVAEFLQLGHERIDANDPDAAEVAFLEAERLAPGEVEIRDLRRRAQRLARKLADAELRAGEMATILAGAEAALTEERPGDALSLAERALTIEPGSAAAVDLLGRAETQLENDRLAAAEKSRPAPVPVSEPPRPVVVPKPVVVPEVVEPEVAPAPLPTTAEINVRFWSEVPQGVLTVYADRDQLFREAFRFTEKRGFLRSKGIAGGFDRTVVVPAGDTLLRIYVVLDKKTKTARVPVSLIGGSSSVLEVRVSPEGSLSADLR